MAFLRVLALVLVVLLAIYLALSAWLRLAERRRLGEEWDAGSAPGAREDHVRAGMADYGRSLRRRLLWLVVALPMAAFLLLLYVLNVA